MKSTKIDWCDCTVNPVVGCPNGCKYCYARKINTRFKWIENWNEPQFFEERLKEFSSKTPKSVFIDSMSDIGTWKDEWLIKVLDAIKKNNQHWYLVLTKTDVRLLTQKIMSYHKKGEAPLKLFIGKSITTQAQADLISDNIELTDFLSIEPILERIDMRRAMITTQTVIIGAETGNRKGKVIPKKEWIDDIVTIADMYKIKVFMKESLRGIMGEDFRQDWLPWKN